MGGVGGSPKPFQVFSMEVPSQGLPEEECVSTLTPPLPSRSSRHGLVNSVSRTRAEDKLKVGRLSAVISTSSRTWDPSPATCFPYLPLLSPYRKFKFNPRLGIDNPALSLAEDQDQSGNPSPLATITFP